MKEFKAIVHEFHKVDFTIRKAALATVVKVSGSSYRSPGARMLITDDGKWVGSISGGCLEGDALRKARKVMMDNCPITVTYDTREESNQNLGIGLGCNGVIDVLIEPITLNQNNNPISLFEKCILNNSSVALATIFKSSKYIGEKLLINEQNTTIQNITNFRLSEDIKENLGELFLSKKSKAITINFEDEEIEVFIELIQPAIKLILFGAGFDARPVCELAKNLGWNVEVTDECVAHIAPLFFPNADNVKLCDRTFIDRDFHINEHTACVLMSHNYDYDKAVLKKLITTNTPYIGILGPKKRLDKMELEFDLENIKFSNFDLQRIHAPIGLDIGAETPDEIAVAIIAEIQTIFSNRKAGFLKNRNQPIHERDTNNDQVIKQSFINNF